MVRFSVRSMLQAIRKVWCKMVLNTAIDVPIQPVIDVLTPHFLGYNPTVVAHYDGSDDVDMPGLIKIKKDGTKGFKIWVIGSCSVRFTNVKYGTLIEGCLVGHGECGGDPQISVGEGNSYNNVGGAGGMGGQVKNIGTIKIWPTFWIDCFLEHDTYIGYGKTGIGARTGTGAVGGNGGTAVQSADFTDTSDPNNPIVIPGAVSVSSPTAGSQGSYAFASSTFDGIRYAPGGGGAQATPNSGFAASGTTQGAPGAGGHGRSSFEEEYDEGNKGIIMFRYSASSVAPTADSTNTARVKYDLAGGSGTFSDQTDVGTPGDTKTFTVRSGIPTKTGYVFIGWTGSNGLTYLAGVSSTVDVVYGTTVTMTASWVEGRTYEYSVLYDADGGSPTPAIQTYSTTATSHTFTLSSTTPTKEGYSFLEWSGSDGLTHQPGTTVTCTSVHQSVWLKAVWAEDLPETATATLWYNLDGGSGSFPTQTYTGTLGDFHRFTIPNSTPTKSGYTFYDWIDSIGNIYDPGDTIDVMCGTVEVLTAFWPEPAPELVEE